MLPDIIVALKDWNNAGPECVLIGASALSYYVKPRMTQNIDVLMLSDNCIPDQVAGFKKINPHTFWHNEVDVEVNIVTPERVVTSPSTIQQVFATAIESDNIKIASPSGLVALKLFQNTIRAVADVVQIIKIRNVEITGFQLPTSLVERFLEILKIAECERQQEFTAAADKYITKRDDTNET
jgi:hypothetical protein